ncbi:CST complex subunit ctc1 [Blyttiomyces sp. JEL0837]|nr:CST complex subunit ctc1 [Blyttiomyces sp. JEL0837]
MNQSWIGQELCLMDWNIAKVESEQAQQSESMVYLESVSGAFALAPGHFLKTTSVYMFSSNEYDPLQDLLTERSSADARLGPDDINLLRCLLCASTQKACGLLLPTSRKSTPSISIIAHVKAKSPIFHDGGSSGKTQSSRFTLELETFMQGCGPTCTSTCFILFEQGRDKKNVQLDVLHKYIRVGEHVRFRGLSAGLVKIPLKNGIREYRILRFSLDHSTVDRVVGLEALLENAQTVPTDAESDDISHHRQHKNSVIISYLGTITKLLDVNSGLYELDGQHELYLLFYPLSNRGLGMRVGTVISLHNIHVVKRKSIVVADNSADRKKPRLVFVACLYTSLDVISFSEGGEVAQVLNPIAKAKIRAKVADFNLSDLIYVRELIATIGQVGKRLGIASTENQSACYHAAARKIVDKFGFVPYGSKVARFSNVFNHAHECDIAEPRFAQPAIYSVLSAQKLVKRFSDSQNHLNSIGSSVISCQINELGIYPMILLGRVDADAAGQFCFRDDSGVWSLTFDEGGVDSGFSQNLPFLCAICHFEAVVEYATSNAGSSSRSYLRCQLTDLVKITNLEKQLKLSPNEPSPQEWALVLKLEHVSQPFIRLKSDRSSMHSAYVEGQAWLIRYQDVINAQGSIQIAGECFEACGEFLDMSAIPKLNRNAVVCLLNAEFQKVLESGKPHLVFSFGAHSQIFDHDSTTFQYKQEIVGFSDRCEVLDVVDVLDEPSFRRNLHAYLFNVRGKILSIRLRLNDAAPSKPMERVFTPSDALGLQDFLSHHSYCIRIQDVFGISSSPLDIYIDLRVMSLPLGLTPGTLVQFTRVLFRCTSGWIYGQVVAQSSVKFLPKSLLSETKHIDIIDSNQIVQSKLCAMSRGQIPGGWISCKLHQILSFRIWLECQHCMNTLGMGARCQPDCGEEEVLMRGIAKVSISDSTLEAIAVFERVEAVIELFHVLGWTQLLDLVTNGKQCGLHYVDSRADRFASDWKQPSDDYQVHLDSKDATEWVQKLRLPLRVRLECKPCGVQVDQGALHEWNPLKNTLPSKVRFRQVNFVNSVGNVAFAAPDVYITATHIQRILSSQGHELAAFIEARCK